MNVVTKQKKSLLIVDDIELLRMALAFEFEGLGYHVLQAESGNKAIAILKKEKIDLVLSDICMPNGSGFDLLEKARRLHHKDPPIILISAFSNHQLIEAFTKGAVDLLSKPFEVDKLIETINWHLQGPPIIWQSKAHDFLLPKPIYESFAQLSPDQFSPQTVTLGRGGFYIPWPKSFQLTEGKPYRFVLSFTAGPLKALDFIGRLRWSNTSEKLIDQGMGVEILQIEAETGKQLVRLAEQYKIIPYIPNIAT